MLKREENRMRKKILEKALSKNLDKMSRSPWIGSLRDAKDLICPFCDQPIKPCKSNPKAVCEQMLLYGTEGKELKDALNNSSSSRLGICISCGKQISIAHFKKHPTAELCTQCVKKGVKMKSPAAIHH